MIRRLLTILIFSSVLMTSSTYAEAQEFVPTEVEISKEKINIRGDMFYAHKVLKGHTLYSISKAYGVDITDIQAANPALQQDGLKAGMLLYIPITENVTKEKTPEKVTEQTTDMPADKSKKKYTKYRPKWYEDLQDIAVKFNVSVQSLCALNNIDPDNTKRIRSILIPDEEFLRHFTVCPKNEEVTTNHDSQQHDTLLVKEDATFIPAIKITGKMYDDGIYPISIVLPFNATESNTNPNTYTTDFYAGCLLAVNDLKKAGEFEHFVLNVIDTDKYGSSWELLADRVLDRSELIIGPISERQLQPIANFGKTHGIPIVSPLDLSTENLADNNPYFFLFPPQADLTIEHQLDKIAKASSDHASDSISTVTVIYEKGYQNSDLVVETIAGLKDRNIEFNVFEYGFLEGRGIDSLITSSLTPYYQNNIIIPSVDEAFVSDALRNLSLIESKGIYNINVYGMSKWKSFETLEPAYLHSLDLRLAVSYHIDYNTSETLDFIKQYKKAFNTFPSSFAFQGYDIITFFVRAMNEYGKDFPVKIINEKKNMLQSDVLFIPVNSGSGYENRAIRDILYTKDWQVVLE